MTLQQHLQPEGKKRILALDGGGIRGALTLGYLQKIEDLLKKQHDNNPDFRLCEYFDLIGGTSTGSIIAACLAIGMTVQEIKDMYLNLGGRIFGSKYKWFEIFKLVKARYNAEPLETELRNLFGDMPIGSDRIRTGLCIVTKRADTNSVWPIINHPGGKFFDSEDGKNKDILLRNAVRASAAAPTYFLPEVINVGGGLPQAAFIDGGLSMANNPALQLLLVATFKGFPFHWQTGADNLLVVSLGTGMGRLNKLPANITDNTLLSWAEQIPDLLMQDATWNNQIILQWLSNSPTRWQIDSEIGNMEGDLLVSDTSKNGLISYLRYNLWLDYENLKDIMKQEYTQQKIDSLVEMSNAENRYELYEIGCKGAERDILENHFPDSFKVTS